VTEVTLRTTFEGIISGALNLQDLKKTDRKGNKD